MPRPGCPAWEYDAHPRCDEVLLKECSRILFALRSERLNTTDTSADTRPIHRQLFSALVPVGFDYYAGNYRGDPSYRCLQDYEVEIGADPRVGCPSDRVLEVMKEVARQIRNTLKVLDGANALPNSQVPREQKVVYVVAFACCMLEFVFRVHPYANGNGHAGRFMIWSVLGRYGYWPKRWPIHPKPPDPPYSDLIEEYRSGNVEPLETYILRTLA